MLSSYACSSSQTQWAPQQLSGACCGRWQATVQSCSCLWAPLQGRLQSTQDNKEPKAGIWEPACPVCQPVYVSLLRHRER